MTGRPEATGATIRSRFRARPRRPAGLVLPLVALAGGAALLSCGRPDGAEHDPLGPNAACYVCHMTFVREEISRVHKTAGVTCIDCHGLSAAHANDEDIGATPPDRAYARAEVNPACRTCHPRHEAPPETVVARWQKVSEARFPDHPPAAAVCTDCHGAHRIAKAP
ncbi:MAG: hypothetical protein ACOC8D_03050 [bacterium]